MDEGRSFPLPIGQNWAWQTQVKPAPIGHANRARATFFTIVTADRAAQSRIFARSARECHPDARLVVVLADGPMTSPIFEDLYEFVIPIDELSIAGLADMRFRYTTAELCFALKPWVIRHLFDRFADDPVYYFDSDIELFSPLAEAEAALAHGANLVLTPHILQPGLDQDRERALLRSGSFNAGFLAIAPSAAARAFVAWWCDRVRTGCTHDALEGTYGDQKWLELAPSICDGVTVLRHPGYNLAYWNAHERPLSCLAGVWTAAGWPLRFIHYSRWNLREQNAEQYLARFFAPEFEPSAGLFAEYRQKVQDESRSSEPHADGGGTPRTPAGEPVPEFVRNAYARHGAAIDGDGAEVFAHAVGVLGAPSKARAALPDLPMTALYDEIWQHHGDLRYRFDVDQETGRLAYLRWLVEAGAAELEIPAAFLGPARSALEQARIRDLEATDEPRPRPTAAPEPAAPDLATPDLPSPDVAATPQTMAVLLAARDAERDRIRQQQGDIRLLVRSNKELRRELHGLRVRRWRDEEAIAALEKEVAQTREARDSAARCSRRLAEEVASLRARPWRRLVARASGGTQLPPAGARRRQLLAADGSFLECGFRHSDAATVAGTAVKRIKEAPSGTFIFGPYVKLSRGTYAVTIDARLYQRLPVLANFKLDIVRDGARQVVGLRRFRLYSAAGWRRFELIFGILDGEESADFEFRVWARRGTPLEIGSIGLQQLDAIDG